MRKKIDSRRAKIANRAQDPHQNVRKVTIKDKTANYLPPLWERNTAPLPLAIGTITIALCPISSFPHLHHPLIRDNNIMTYTARSPLPNTTTCTHAHTTNKLDFPPSFSPSFLFLFLLFLLLLFLLYSLLAPTDSHRLAPLWRGRRKEEVREGERESKHIW